MALQEPTASALTAEERAELAAHWDYLFSIPPEEVKDYELREMAVELRDELARVRAALRAVANANPIAYEERGARCTLCDGVYDRLSDGSSGVQHSLDCPWRRARALVGEGA